MKKQFNPFKDYLLWLIFGITGIFLIIFFIEWLT